MLHNKVRNRILCTLSNPRYNQFIGIASWKFDNAVLEKVDNSLSFKPQDITDY